MTATAFDAGMAVAAHLNNQTIARTKTPLVSIRKTGIFEIDKADAVKVDGTGLGAALVLVKTGKNQFRLTSRGDSSGISGIGTADTIAETLASAVTSPRMLITDKPSTFDAILRAARDLESGKAVFRMWDRQRIFAAGLLQDAVDLASKHFISPNSDITISAVTWAAALGTDTEDPTEGVNAIIEAIESLGFAKEWVNVIAAECVRFAQSDLKCPYSNPLWVSVADELCQYDYGTAVKDGYDSNLFTDPIWADRSVHDGNVIRGVITQSEKNEDWFAIAIETQLRLKVGKEVNVGGHSPCDKSGKSSNPNFKIREIEATADGLVVHVAQHSQSFRQIPIDGSVIDLYVKPDDTKGRVQSVLRDAWRLRRKSWISDTRRPKPEIAGDIPVHVLAALGESAFADAA